MLSQQARAFLLIVALVLFIPVGILQTKIIDPWRPRYEPVGVGVTQDVNEQITTRLPIQFALPALVGFREVIAGLLWVRADEFFDDGDYAAIVPIVRLICWLDPHQVDVYETGAWHMDYNFTDAQNRSDKRYIPISIALMKEAIANNPDIPDVYADLAFTHYYRKVNDFQNAAKYYADGQVALERVDNLADENPGNQSLQQAKAAADTTVTPLCHGLAHAYEEEGNIPAAIAQWKYVIARHQADVKTDGDLHGPAALSLYSANKNLYELEQRAKYRPIDTKVPIDLHFNATVTVVGPKAFEVKGTLDAIGAESFDFNNHKVLWGPVDGCRAEVRLTDAGYKTPTDATFGLFNNNLGTVTIMQDSISVRNGKFDRTFDLSQDPSIYGFTAQKYTISIWFDPENPLDTPPNVQDRLGWMGEGLDKNQKYYDGSGWVPGIDDHPSPGLSILKKTFTLSRDDIMMTSDHTKFD